MIVDTHCHLDFDELQPLLTEDMGVCAGLGVRGFLVPGVKRAFWSRQKALLTKYPGCRIALGLHPYYIAEHRLDDLDILQQLTLAQQEGVVAIGEIGLDKKFDQWALQVELFRLQVRIADSNGLPILIHSRKAHSEILQLLSVEKFKGRGVIHGFSGSFELAMSYWRKGIYIGVGGVITYPAATKTRDSIAKMPLCSLLLETDAPSMPIYEQQGKYNVPSNVAQVLSMLKSIREESGEIVEQQIYRNSCKLLEVNKW